MRQLTRQRLAASAVALALGLALVGVASAQATQQTSDAGLLVGEVARCVNGAEQPAPQRRASASMGGSGALARTRLGRPVLPARCRRASTRSRHGDRRDVPVGQYVPVEAGAGARHRHSRHRRRRRRAAGPIRRITAAALPTVHAAPPDGRTRRPPPSPTPAPTADGGASADHQAPGRSADAAPSRRHRPRTTDASRLRLSD